MKFIENVDKKQYEKFVKSNKKSHFLQSYAWGEFAKIEKHLTPHYVGLVNNDNELIATALLLEKKLPLKLSYFYCPRGYILDYDNKELLKEFTEKLKIYLKKHNAIFIKIDPDIIYNQIDNQGNKIVDNNNTLIETLTKLGYKHLGFTKNFETMQPRYTFRINFLKKIDEIENNYTKTTKQRIKKADDFFIETKIGNKDDINTFYNLMIITENRKDFVSHNEKYYKSLYEIWNRDNSCNVFLGQANLDKIINKFINIKSELKENLEKLSGKELSRKEKTEKQELEKRLKKLNNDIERYLNIKNKYGNIITLSAHFIIEYGNKAWVLYAGNHNILTDTYTNYKTYNEHIKYYHQKKIEVYDQFGTIGDLKADNPLIGLHEFKKKFGGDYIEFIGEFDYITNKLMYFIFVKLVPIYRNFIKKRAKKKIKNRM